MQVAVTSLLRDKLPPFYRVFHSVFYSLCTFISLIEIVYYCISVFMVASLIYFYYMNLLMELGSTVLGCLDNCTELSCRVNEAALSVC
jgi:hypothetical protein